MSITVQFVWKGVLIMMTKLVCFILLCSISFGNPPQGTTKTSVRNNTTTYYSKSGFLGQSTTRNGRTSFSDRRGNYGFSRNVNGQQKFIQTRTR